MAYAKIKFKNHRTGFTREAPIGFSWTTLLFGPFPALLRGDYKYGIVILLFALFTMGLSSIAFAFFYNTAYAKGLVNDGYEINNITPEDMQKIEKRNPELAK